MVKQTFCNDLFIILGIYFYFVAIPCRSRSKVTSGWVEGHGGVKPSWVKVKLTRKTFDKQDMGWVVLFCFWVFTKTVY